MKDIYKKRNLVVVLLFALLFTLSLTGFASASYSDNRQDGHFVYYSTNEIFMFDESVCNDHVDCQYNENDSKNLVTRAGFPTCQKAGCPTNSVSQWTVVSTSTVPITPYYTKCDGSCGNPNANPNNTHYITGTKTTTVYRCNNCSSTYTHITQQLKGECYP